MAFLTSSLQLTSPAFADNTAIPEKYSVQGSNINPPLEISGLPFGTRSFALMMHDPDAAGGDWLHWAVYNIPRETVRIEEGALPVGALEGMNNWSRVGYGGPNPPVGTGTHHYIFELYALPIIFELDMGVDRPTLEQHLHSVQIQAQTTLTGLYTAASAA